MPSAFFRPCTYGISAIPLSFERPCAMPDGAPKSIFRNTVCRLFSPAIGSNRSVSRSKASHELLHSHRQLLYRCNSASPSASFIAIRALHTRPDSEQRASSPTPILSLRSPLRAKRAHPGFPTVTCHNSSEEPGSSSFWAFTVHAIKRCHGEIISVFAERA